MACFHHQPHRVLLSLVYVEFGSAGAAGTAAFMVLRLWELKRKGFRQPLLGQDFLVLAPCHALKGTQALTSQQLQERWVGAYALVESPVNTPEPV